MVKLELERQQHTVTIVFCFFDNLVATTRLARTTRTTKARTARMAEMAGVARTSTASLSRHSTWCTLSNVRGPSINFAEQLHIRSLFSRSFASKQYRFHCEWRGVWTVHRTAHASHVPYTHMFSFARGSKCLGRVVVLSFLKIIPSNPCFMARCLMHLFINHSLLHFWHWHPVRWLLLRCCTLRRVQPLPLRKEGCCLAAWPNNLL